jgi:predicted dienelactone hydrolase
VTRTFLATIGILLFAAGNIHAMPAGETRRVAADPTASLRDSEHRPEVRVTVWYPAAPGAAEHPVAIGPPDNPLFEVGSVAPDATFAPGADRRPVILLSHGFGGSARIMGWFGIALARDGYIVVAVDHPGNTGADKMTIAGAVLYWDRAEDLRVALKVAEQDPFVGPHMDPSRVGVAGFSAGGFTALVAAGARPDPDHLARFCSSNPDDGICRPQQEFAFSTQDAIDLLHRPEIQAEAAHATASHAISEVRAAFAMAPGLVQALQPASLENIRLPVEIILGDADTVAPPSTNGLIAARIVPNASLIRLPGVGHYDFLSTCTQSGRATLARCKVSVPQETTHRQAIEAAETFFGRTLSVPH